ncbi:MULTISPECIES: ABC transporter permease [unclassified Devosia]|uniref:ABC transporter permease n=1 Tax=unclassified Devosia TaxID=196773 RepID=UPI001552B811|nr:MULTISPECIES: ABC transporter permease [unclassified Devosia]
MAGLFQAALNYRYFIWSAIRLDFRARVARSGLGVLWIVLSPLSQVAIYAFVLSALMSSRLPGIDNRFAYSIYLMAGFSAWFLFTEILNRSLTIFIDNANALKKIAFPRIVLPLITLGAALVNNLIFFVLVLAAYALLGHNPGWALLWFPVLTVLTAALGLGLGLTLGVLNVFIRDVAQAVGILLQFGFWMTPIVYIIDIIPESYRFILMFNPMFWVVDGYHRVLVYGQAPNLLSLACLAVLAVGLMALAMTLFRRSSGEMVDVL